MSLIAIIKGNGVVPGRAEGLAMVSREAIQGWSGVDERTGLVVEEGHPFFGQSIRGKVLVLSGGKGSNGWSIHFHAAKIKGIGPSALILPHLDSRMAVAAAVLDVPVLTALDCDPFELIPMEARVVVDADLGTAEIWDY
jgi:predicted aconitase with swiveling domain